jgi:rod shape determining protein RodA
MSIEAKSLTGRLDWNLVLIYLALTCIGILCIFSVEHRSTDTTLLLMDKSYMRQFIWFGISIVVATIIILMDSRFFTSGAYLGYVIGFFILFLPFTPLGKGVKGSQSFVNLGFASFQPGELMKLFAALSIAKFLSSSETDFSSFKHRLVCAAFAIIPMIIILLQNETGLALVYLAFFLAMYREGLPNIIIVIGFSVLALTIATLIIPKNILFIILTILAGGFIFSQRKQLMRNKELVVVISIIWFVGVLFSQVIVPFTFKNVLKGYQVQRIYTMIGQEVPEDYKGGSAVKKQNASEYNVSQSKIAIAAGGFWGKGFLNGTQTQYNWVPEQRTDFIFCTVGEQFGFIGSFVLLGLYVLFLLRIVYIAERQRSRFTRVYAYCVAAILFFHLMINIGMTVGLAPVIGIPLPLLSYGGTSLLTFTILIFILVRLDADRTKALH